MLAACALLLACGVERRSCVLEAPVPVTRSDGLSFDGVAIAVLDRRGPLFAWSDARGLAVKLAREPASVRVGERCTGGIALLAHGDSAYLACSRAARTADDAASPTNEVGVYAIDTRLQARLIGSLGAVGRDGHGVALAHDRDGLHVAYHDGSIGEHAIILATLRENDARSTRVSPPGAAAADPTLLAHEGHLYTAYSQLELTPDGAPASSIWIARDLAAPRRIHTTRVHAPTPKLTADARGVVLAYRDLPPRKTRAELFVTRLDADLSMAAAPRAIGRANGEGDPSLRACGGLTTAVLPREYGRERFVGIHALDGALAALGAGHQFYASEREFVLASAACVDDQWLVLAADRASPGKPGVEAVALGFHCE